MMGYWFEYQYTMSFTLTQFDDILVCAHEL